MNKTIKTLLAIIAGIDATLYIFTPIILITIWNTISTFGNTTAYFLYAISFASSIFRAIKVGWMK